MSSPSLDILPAEILVRVCGYLDGQDQSDLRAFASANKACHALAASCLYHTLSIRINTAQSFRQHLLEQLQDPPQLAADVHHWQALLERCSAYKHVRCLKVVERWADDPWRPRQPSHLDFLAREDDFAEPPMISLDMPSKIDRAKRSSASTDEDGSSWLALAGLLVRLPGLANLHFDTSWPLPSCVRRFLESPGCHCSLHLTRFWFQGYLYPAIKSPEELRLLCCPRLYSVRTRSCGYGEEEVDFTHESMLALLGGLNPALRRVSLITDVNGAYGGMAAKLRSRPPRPPWPGFTPGKELRSTQPAPLISFEMGGTSPVSLELLQMWLRQCDVSQLRVLKLRLSIRHQGLGLLASDARFEALTTLVLGDNKSQHIPGKRAQANGYAAAFLGALPPLRAIRFREDIDDSIFYVTLERHGKSLRRLWFAPPLDAKGSSHHSPVFFTPSKTVELQRSCPLLEDLAVSIPRSMGDTTEVEMYRALGGLPRLQTLALALDCEDDSLNVTPRRYEPLSPDLSFDDFDNRVAGERIMTFQGPRGGRLPRYGHVRVAMINAALDETLARSIFETVSKAKPNTPGVIPLHRVELRPVRGNYIEEAEDIIRHLGMWWLLERDRRCDRQCEFTAERLFYPGDCEVKRNSTWDPRSGLAIFRRIWPEHPHRKGNWTEDWSSRCLAL